MTAGWWRFVPADGALPSAETMVAAAIAGKGALARELREARAVLGTARACILLRLAQTRSAASFGEPVRLLLVTAQQPRALMDGLRLGFAIAGLSADIRAIEGLSNLRAALGDPESADFSDTDLSLFFLPDAAGDSHALISELAGQVAARSLAPVGVARFEPFGAEPPSDQGGAIPLDLAMDGPVFDTRFAATFGAILTAAAADLLADKAAGLAAQLKGTAPKLLVSDLDETLWHGVLGEAGEAEAAPVLDFGYTEALLKLRRRGIVLAIASRNDPAAVERHFATLETAPLGLADFSAQAIGWSDKATLVAEILGTLGLSPEHTVFVDDDPVNCAKVAARFPEMDVRRFSGDGFAAALVADPLLAERAAAGTETRADQYARKASVDRLRADLSDEALFLQRLKTTVTIEPLSENLLTRATELAARVNQFRFTALRPGRLQLGARPGDLDFMVRLEDAFGAHGLVGLVLASEDGDNAVIDGLWLSCRALERRVESAMLHALGLRARARGSKRIVGRIEIIERNEPARDCLACHGFIERAGEWHYDLAPGFSGIDAPVQGISMIDQLYGRDR